MSNSLDPDDSSGLICVQTVCQGYQQTTLVDKELIFVSLVAEKINIFLNCQTTEVFDLITLKLDQTDLPEGNFQKDAYQTANSEDPDQTAPLGEV